MIQVLHRAFDILELLAKDPDRPKPLGEVAGALSLNSATCANILKTMVDRGYVRQEAPKKGYTIGLAWRGFVREDVRYRRLITAAEAPMTHLASSVRETVLLAVLEGQRRFNLCLVEGDASLQVRRDIIISDDIYRTATGRLLLAHLGPASLEAVLVRRGLPRPEEWPEAGSPDELRSTLARVRDEGRVIITRGDLVAMAYPIRVGGAVTAALGLYLPAFRFDGEHRGRVLQDMEETAGTISRHLAEGETS